VSPNLTCWSNEHSSVVAVAAIGLVVYTFGVPFVYCLILWYGKKKNLLAVDWFLARFRFLYARYEPDFFWWELMILGRRAFFAIALVGLRRVPIFQAGMGLGVIILVPPTITR